MNSIVLQPVTITSNLGLVCQFQCEGSSGAVYQWQYRFHNQQFSDIAGQVSYMGGTFDFNNIISNQNILKWVPFTYEMYYRCKITFPDSEILYTNEVEILQGNPPDTGIYNDWYYSELHSIPDSQKWHNINKLMNAFVYRFGWSKEFASAVCGNIWAESWASPDCWESFIDNISRGYGFVQWTAAIRTIIPFCFNTYPEGQWRHNGDYQIERLYYEWQNNIEFVGYGGWAGNVHSDRAPAELAENFVRGYLRPTQAEIESSLHNRMAYSIRVFENFTAIPLIPILKKLTIEGRRNR